MVNQIKAQVNLDLTGKKISAFIVWRVVDYFKDKPTGDVVNVKTDNYQAIKNDLASWSKMTGCPVRMIEQKEDYLIHEFIKNEKINKDKIFAMVISENDLEKLLSPLGLAVCCCLSGYEVNIYFQGPAVKTLSRGFKEKLPGFSSIFSGFARKGLEKIGHVQAQEKLRIMQELGAKFYVCEPSMDHFGVKEKDIVFEGIILCEYLTFLDIFGSADLKLFLQ